MSINFYSNFWCRRFRMGQAYWPPIAPEPQPKIPSQLVVAPGLYDFGGGSVLQAYDLSEPGYYVFVSPDYLPQPGAQTGGMLQAIVPEGDLAADCAATCYGMRYGGKHEPADQSPAGIANLVALMRTSFISAQCGTLARMAKSILTVPLMGYQCRLVQMVTSEPPNYTTDGHVLCEVRQSSSDPWLAFDPLVHVLYELDVATIAANGWSPNMPRTHLTPLVSHIAGEAYPEVPFPVCALGVLFQWDGWCEYMNRCKDQVSYP